MVVLVLVVVVVVVVGADSWRQRVLLVHVRRVDDLNRAPEPRMCPGVGGRAAHQLARVVSVGIVDVLDPSTGVLDGTVAVLAGSGAVGVAGRPSASSAEQGEPHGDHEDSAGHRGLVPAGVVQRLGAGGGVVHSEHNGSQVDEAHVVQMWLGADHVATPSYASCALDDAELEGSLVPVASGIPGRDGVVRLVAPGAALHVGRLGAGASRPLPAAPMIHLHVARGTVLLEGVGRLSAGDAVRLSDGGGRLMTGDGAGIAGTADASAELLVWELHPRAG